MKLLKKLAVIAFFIGAQQMSAMNEQELAAYRRQGQLEDAAQEAREALDKLLRYNRHVGKTLAFLNYWKEKANLGDEYAKKEVERFNDLLKSANEERAEVCADLRNNLLKNNIFLQEPDTSVKISQGQGWVELHYNSKKMREDINHESNKKIEPIELMPSSTRDWKK